MRPFPWVVRTTTGCEHFVGQGEKFFDTTFATEVGLATLAEFTFATL